MGPLAEQIAFLDRVALAEEAALYADRAAAAVQSRRLLLREIADQPADNAGQGVAPPPAGAEMIERQWALVERLAQGLVDTYGPEYRL